MQQCGFYHQLWRAGTATKIEPALFNLKLITSFLPFQNLCLIPNTQIQFRPVNACIHNIFAQQSCWKLYEGTKISFMYCLQQIQQPHPMSQHFLVILVEFGKDYQKQIQISFNWWWDETCCGDTIVVEIRIEKQIYGGQPPPPLFFQYLLSKLKASEFFLWNLKLW